MDHRMSLDVSQGVHSSLRNDVLKWISVINVSLDIVYNGKPSLPKSASTVQGVKQRVNCRIEWMCGTHSPGEERNRSRQLTPSHWMLRGPTHPIRSHPSSLHWELATINRLTVLPCLPRPNFHSVLQAVCFPLNLILRVGKYKYITFHINEHI